MAISIGAFRASLSLDASPYTKGILDAQSVTAVFGQTVTTLVNNPLLGTVEILKQAAGVAVRVAGDTLDYAESISRVAGEANIATDTLQTLREVLEDAGRGAEGAEAAAQKFNIRLGELKDGAGNAADEFREIGLDPSTFKDTDDALRRTIDALAAMEDRSRAAYLAGQLFERQYGRSIVDALTKSGQSLGELESRYRRFGVVLSTADLELAARLDDRFDEIGNRIQGIKRQIGIGLIDGFEEGASKAGGLNALDSLGPDLRGASKELGGAVGQLAPLIRDFVGGVASLTSGLREFISLSRETALTGNNRDRYGNKTSTPATDNLVDWLRGNPSAARDLYGPRWREALREPGGAR